MELKALEILKAERRDINESIRNLPYLSNNKNHLKENLKFVDEAIIELEKLNNKTCRNCNLDFSFCEIFYGANSRICLSPDGFNCSLHSWKK